MKTNRIISGIVAVCGGIANYLWGGWDMALRTLLLFMLLDYILGVVCSAKEKCTNSEVAFRGILKKVAVLVVVAVGVSLDCAAGTDGLIRGLVLFFYVGIEGISILENAAKLGVPIPEKLKDALIQLKDSE